MRVDHQSETWFAVEKFIAAERLAAMKQLTNPKNDLATTQFYRGIAIALDRLEALSLPGVTPAVEIPVGYEPGSV